MQAEYHDIKEWFPIFDIQGNEIVLKNKNRICAYQILPTNFRLKTMQEQSRILKEFKTFLKNMGTSFQIVIQTDRINLEDYYDHMRIINQKKKYLTKMVEDYIDFVKKTVKERECISRRYYLIMPKTQSVDEKIISHFPKMENEITKLQAKETEELLKRCFKKCTAIRKDAKWV